jgi:hypothetical protein
VRIRLNTNGNSNIMIVIVIVLVIVIVTAKVYVIVIVAPPQGGKLRAGSAISGDWESLRQVPDCCQRWRRCSVVVLNRKSLTETPI